MSETNREILDTKPDARPAEFEQFPLYQQLETRERLVRLEEENRHLKEMMAEQKDKYKLLRQNLDDLRSEQNTQLNERAWKLSQRTDTLARRLDRLFGFWVLSTMMLMLFFGIIMFKANVG